MTGNGTKNLIVGRQDGNIEVYNINIDDPVDIPISIFSYVCIFLFNVVTTFCDLNFIIIPQLKLFQEG